MVIVTFEETNLFIIQLWPVKKLNTENCQHETEDYYIEGATRSKITFKG